MNSGRICETLREAAEKRAAFRAHSREENTNCYRLVNGDADGLPGIVIEIFASIAIVQVFEGRSFFSEEALLAAEEWLVTEKLAERVFRKSFVVDRRAPLPDAPPEEPVLAEERGVKFVVRPSETFSVGLFLDQRENRRFLTTTKLPDGPLLNLFCYTGSFSVVAAAKGRETLSVDVSNRYLRWGKENFAANELALDGHRFWEEDARTAVARLGRREEKFAAIVIDPPTFGRSKKGAWQIERDFPTLAQEAVALLRPGGLLLVTANTERWAPEDFRSSMREALETATAEELLPPPPLDFFDSLEPLRQLAFRR